MDSKPTFGILLVLVGLLFMWLLVTGKLNWLITQFRTGFNPTSTGPAANVVGGNAAPLGGARVATSGQTAQNLGGSLLAYGVVVGDGGAKIEPIGAVSVG